MTSIGLHEDLPYVFETTMHPIQILQHEMGNLKTMPADVRISPDVSKFTCVDFHQDQEIIDKGTEATKGALPAVRHVPAE